MSAMNRISEMKWHVQRVVCVISIVSEILENFSISFVLLFDFPWSALNLKHTFNALLAYTTIYLYMYWNCDNIHTQYITRIYSFRSNSHLTFPWQLCDSTVSFFTWLFSLCISSVSIIALHMPLCCWSEILWHFLRLLWPNIWLFFIVLLHRAYFQMIHMLNGIYIIFAHGCEWNKDGLVFIHCWHHCQTFEIHTALSCHTS